MSPTYREVGGAHRCGRAQDLSGRLIERSSIRPRVPPPTATRPVPTARRCIRRGRALPGADENLCVRMNRLVGRELLAALEPSARGDRAPDPRPPGPRERACRRRRHRGATSAPQPHRRRAHQGCSAPTALVRVDDGHLHDPTTAPETNSRDHRSRTVLDGSASRCGELARRPRRAGPDRRAHHGVEPPGGLDADRGRRCRASPSAALSRSRTCIGRARHGRRPPSPRSRR